MPQKMKPGDIVRVTRAPSDLPDDSKRIFELCMGKTFSIAAIEDDGRIELLVGQVVGEADYMHSIYLWPDEVELVERSG